MTELRRRTLLAGGLAVTAAPALSRRGVAPPAPWGAAPSPRQWRWHAREELGHRDVAIDAVMHMGIGWVRRSLAYALASAYLLFDVLRLWIALCRCDVAAGSSRWRLARQAAGFVVGAVPTAMRLALGWVGYLLPGRRSLARQP